MRDPSLHIKRSVLTETLTAAMRMHGNNAELLVEEIMEAGKNNLPVNRMEAKLTKPLQNKVNRMMRTSQKDIEHFNRLLYLGKSIHVQKNVKNINKESREYLMLCDITGIAIEFCEYFQLDKGDGFKKFIDTGIELMNKKYTLNRFKTFRERIFNRFGDNRVLLNDTNKAGTEEMYLCWQAIMNEQTGQILILHNTADKYVHFCHAREEADNCEAEYNDWVKAQFSGLAWTESVPELIQFHGEESIVRYGKYMKKVQDLIKEYNLTDTEKIKFYKKEVWKI